MKQAPRADTADVMWKYEVKNTTTKSQVPPGDLAPLLWQKMMCLKEKTEEGKKVVFLRPMAGVSQRRDDIAAY